MRNVQCQSKRTLSADIANHFILWEDKTTPNKWHSNGIKLMCKIDYKFTKLMVANINEAKHNGRAH